MFFFCYRKTFDGLCKQSNWYLPAGVKEAGISGDVICNRDARFSNWLIICRSRRHFKPVGITHNNAMLLINNRIKYVMISVKPCIDWRPFSKKIKRKHIFCCNELCHCQAPMNSTSGRWLTQNCVVIIITKISSGIDSMPTTIDQLNSPHDSPFGNKSYLFSKAQLKRYQNASSHRCQSMN